MKLYRLEYSCYARKAQMALDLLGLRYDCIEVPFGDRSELATLTGGYIQVPVLVDDDGRVTVDSRAICEKLAAEDSRRRLVPPALEGPIWAYADWCDGPLEDVMFRLASPPTRRRFTDAWERALYVFIKERKFGRGCVDEWERSRETLFARARSMLEPSRMTLRQRPFLFGDTPTLADAALYGQMIMLSVAAPAFGPELTDWMSGVEKAASS